MRDADPSEDASHIVIIGRLAKPYLQRGEQTKGHDSSPTIAEGEIFESVNTYTPLWRHRVSWGLDCK